MNRHPDVHHEARFALELFPARPDFLYSLEQTAALARVPRRVLLVYSRAGLVRPVFQPPYGAIGFGEEAIYTVRRVEQLRLVHGLARAPLASSGASSRRSSRCSSRWNGCARPCDPGTTARFLPGTPRDRAEFS